jgi:hypothetical protein
MFSILIKNYIKSFFGSIGYFRKTNRIKHEFEIHGYLIYIDSFCSCGSEMHKNHNRIIDYYTRTLYDKDIKWGLEIYFSSMVSSRDTGDLKGYKIVQDFIEGKIMSSVDFDINAPQIYINELIIKSPSDRRDDEINKVLCP